MWFLSFFDSNSILSGWRNSQTVTLQAKEGLSASPARRAERPTLGRNLEGARQSALPPGKLPANSSNTLLISRPLGIRRR